jgi:hypothetical protein
MTTYIPLAINRPLLSLTVNSAKPNIHGSAIVGNQSDNPSSFVRLEQNRNLVDAA